MSSRSLSALVLLTCLLWGPAAAQSQTAAKTPQATPPTPASIQWFGSWEQARKEAVRTGRPLLLTAAAPHCRGIPGMW